MEASSCVKEQLSPHPEETSATAPEGCKPGCFHTAALAERLELGCSFVSWGKEHRPADILPQQLTSVELSFQVDHHLESHALGILVAFTSHRFIMLNLQPGPN